MFLNSLIVIYFVFLCVNLHNLLSNENVRILSKKIKIKINIPFSTKFLIIPICLIILAVIVVETLNNRRNKWEEVFFRNLNINYDVLDKNNLNIFYKLTINKNNYLISKYACDTQLVKDIKVIEYLKAQGYNLNAPLPDGRNALICLLNNQIFFDYINLGADLNFVNSINGWTIFHYIAENPYQLSNISIETLIRNAAANLNILSQDDLRTALHNAAYYGRESIVLLYLKYGANKNIRNMMGDLPIDWARSQGKTKTVEILQ
jgi:ankyrin repeat protein